MGQPGHFLHFKHFTSYSRFQRDSSSVCRSKREAHWPLDPHHSPLLKFVEMQKLSSVLQVAFRFWNALFVPITLGRSGPNILDNVQCKLINQKFLVKLMEKIKAVRRTTSVNFLSLNSGSVGINNERVEKRSTWKMSKNNAKLYLFISD